MWWHFKMFFFKKTVVFFLIFLEVSIYKRERREPSRISNDINDDVHLLSRRTEVQVWYTLFTVYGRMGVSAYLILNAPPPSKCPPLLFGIFENCFITAGQNLNAPPLFSKIRPKGGGASKINSTDDFETILKWKFCNFGEMIRFWANPCMADLKKRFTIYHTYYWGWQ